MAIGHVNTSLEMNESSLRKRQNICYRYCSELSHVFGGEKLPEPISLKSRFDEKFDKFSDAKKKIEVEIQRLKAEANSKRDHRKSFQQDLTGKEVGLAGFSSLFPFSHFISL